MQRSLSLNTLAVGRNEYKISYVSINLYIINHNERISIENVCFIPCTKHGPKNERQSRVWVKLRSGLKVEARVKARFKVERRALPHSRGQWGHLVAHKTSYQSSLIS